MFAYVARRIMTTIPLLLVGTFIVYALTASVSNPLAKLATCNTCDQAAFDRIIDLYNLDQPIHLRYANWMIDAATGDMGAAPSQGGTQVFPLVMDRMANTAQLAIPAFLIIATLAILLGVYSAVNQYSKSDYFVTGFSFVGISMPTFFFALVLQVVFGVWWQDWFDAKPFYVSQMHMGSFVDIVRSHTLPIVTLVLVITAAESRFERASMLEVINSDYIRTARAKGLPRRRVILKHGLRNAMIPLVTIWAIDFAALLGGSVVTETIFSWPGLGPLLLSGIFQGDLNLTMGIVMVVALLVIVFNLIADLVYGMLDPRIRYEQPRPVESLTAEPDHSTAEAEPATMALSDDVIVDEREGMTISTRSFGRQTWDRFRRHKIAMFAAVLLILLAISFWVAPVLSPYGFRDIDVAAMREGPSLRHPFGTDQIGRDLMVRTFHGGRFSLRIALVVALLTTAIGTVIGSLAGYFGGIVDTLLSQLINLFLIVPALVVLLVVGVRYGASPNGIAIILAFLLWPAIARVVRGLFLQFRDQEFVLAARAAGARPPRIIIRHILPNTFGPIIVNATLLIGTAIILESTLSFLGVGVTPPTPTLGNLVNEAKGAIDSRPSTILIPGGFVVLIALCVNFLGDGLRDALDPTTRKG